MGKGLAAAATFDPAEWRILGYFYTGDSEEMAEVYQSDIYDLEEAIGTAEAEAILEVGKCESCGTNFLHGAVVENTIDFGRLIIGQICAHEYFSLPNVVALRTAEARKLKQKKEWEAKTAAKRAAFLADNPGLEEALETDHYIVADIGSRFDKWGDLSPRQVELVFKLAAEAAERAATPAEPEKPLVPVVEGVQTITGTILGLKYQEGFYGTTRKMLAEVEAEGGVFKLWGTIPKALNNGGDSELKGRRFSLIAEVEASRDDESFGFFSRPRQAKWL